MLLLLRRRLRLRLLLVQLHLRGRNPYVHLSHANGVHFSHANGVSLDPREGVLTREDGQRVELKLAATVRCDSRRPLLSFLHCAGLLSREHRVLITVYAVVVR